MKYIAASILALASSTTAFAPSQNAARSTSALGFTNKDLDDLPGSTPPLKSFDPVGYSKVGSDETFQWFRAAELKHGRVAMVATTGYLIQAAGFHFPGMLSSDISFESLAGMSPPDQWAAVPDVGKAQIFATIFCAEIASETKKPHYMMGGEFPTVVFPKFDFSGVDPVTLKTKQSRELNNGRLAQIAIISFLCERAIPGSVPALSGIEAFH